LVHAVAAQLGTDPQRPLPAHGTRARQAAGKAHIVLPARLGHLRHRGARLLGGDAPGQQLAGQLGTGVLAPHQQRERLLRRRGLAPWPPHPRLLRVGVVAFRLGFGRHELLAQRGLQGGGDFRVVLQELAGVLLALADALVAVAVPGAGLLDQARVHAHVDQFALAGDALPVQDLGDDLLERGRELVLDYLDPGLVADDLVALLDGTDAAYVQAHRR